jgi:LPS-assembly lipoprotein
MWWLSIFSRTVVLLILVTLLSGCGFRPLYLKGKQNLQPELASIEISPIIDRKGQILRNFLLDQLSPKGQPGHPDFVLSVSINYHVKYLGIRHDDLATRALFNTTATYELRRKQDAAQIYSGTSYASSGYDILISDFATLVAEKDALEHSLETISQDIKLQLSFLFSSDPSGNKAAKKFWAKQQKQKKKGGGQKRGEGLLEREEEKVR